VRAFAEDVHGNATYSEIQKRLISEQEIAPRINFKMPSQRVKENIGEVSISVNLNTISNQIIHLPFTISGTTNLNDYHLRKSTIDIPAGVKNYTFSCQIIDDDLYEHEETIVLTMTQPDNAQSDCPYYFNH